MYIPYSEPLGGRWSHSQVTQVHMCTFYHLQKPLNPAKTRRGGLLESPKHSSGRTWTHTVLKQILCSLSVIMLSETHSSPSVLTIRIRSSSRFLRTVANSCKDLAGKEKGAVRWKLDNGPLGAFPDTAVMLWTEIPRHTQKPKVNCYPRLPLSFNH